MKFGVEMKLAMEAMKLGLSPAAYWELPLFVILAKKEEAEKLAEKKRLS